MPIYEYTCEACGHEFQVVSTIAEHRRGGTGCPRCRNSLVALNHAAFHACEGKSGHWADNSAHPIRGSMPQF